METGGLKIAMRVSRRTRPPEITKTAGGVGSRGWKVCLRDDRRVDLVFHAEALPFDDDGLGAVEDAV